jgi:hypothetical protein
MIRLSHRLYGIAADSQLWRKAYYERFVRPRTARIRATPYSYQSYSSKLSNWLDEENLIKRGRDTNWKWQYKLRHNWSRGTCNVSEIQVAEARRSPPLLVKLHDGVVYTSDSISGLKAWGSKKEKKLLASIKHKDTVPPMSLAIDTSEGEASLHRILVGYKDGSFTIYSFFKSLNKFHIQYEHQPSSNDMLLGIACHFPFLLTLSASQVLSVYKLSHSNSTPGLDPPLLLDSLHSQTIWSPFSLSIRPTSTNTIIATIAYSIPTILNWAVGIQELRLHSETGIVLTSRMATSPSGSGLTLGSTLLATSSPSTRSSSPFPTLGTASFSKPTSLSYTHPYLLLSHPDNTLTTFLVTSTADALTVSLGTRLWGHTSSVSAAHVECRGKAVSVTERGEEMRIWELEGSAGRRPGIVPRKGSDVNPTSSVRITAEKRIGQDEDEEGLIRGWVGFDEENVIVLKERAIGGQDLLVYNFS